LEFFGPFLLVRSIQRHFVQMKILTPLFFIQTLSFFILFIFYFLFFILNYLTIYNILIPLLLIIAINVNEI
jgi:hypothetical protein